MKGRGVAGERGSGDGGGVCRCGWGWRQSGGVERDFITICSGGDGGQTGKRKKEGGRVVGLGDKKTKT